MPYLCNHSIGIILRCDLYLPSHTILICGWYLYSFSEYNLYPKLEYTWLVKNETFYFMVCEQRGATELHVSGHKSILTDPHGHPRFSLRHYRANSHQDTQIDDQLLTCACAKLSPILTSFQLPQFFHLPLGSHSPSLVYHLLYPHSPLWNFPSCLTETWISTE